MPTRYELAAEYDDARVELDRANVEALMVRRRARLAKLPVAAADLEAVRLRIREANRWVTRVEYAFKAAGWAPVRLTGIEYWERRKAQLQAERWAA